VQKQKKRRAVLDEKYQHFSGMWSLRWAYPPNVYPYQQRWQYEMVTPEVAREFEVGTEHTITFVDPRVAIAEADERFYKEHPEKRPEGRCP
jgi:hypothetical protein